MSARIVENRKLALVKIGPSSRLPGNRSFDIWENSGGLIVFLHKLYWDRRPRFKQALVCDPKNRTARFEFVRKFPPSLQICCNYCQTFTF